MKHATDPVFYDQRLRLRVVQSFGVLTVPLVLLSHPIWNQESFALEAFELVGLTFLLICIFGRLWSILYSGGRKNVELVTEGPYSITRNPLYLFSTLGAAGIGFLFGSLLLAILIGGVAYAIFHITAQGEAAFLRSRFGREYDRYSRRVPFFWPRPSLYNEAQDAVFSPKALRTTFRDALYFLLVVPTVEVVEYLRNWGVMPDIFPVF